MRIPRWRGERKARVADPDADLGWTPIRDVPAWSTEAIADAQVLLQQYVTNHDLESAAALATAWNSVVADLRFEAAPLSFRLDMLNRRAIATSWQAANAKSVDGFDAAIRQWCNALELVPDGWRERLRYLTNVGSQYLERYGLTNNEADLENSIKSHLEAIDAARDWKDYSVGLAHYNAVYALTVRYRKFGDHRDLRSAVEVAESGLRSATAARADRLNLFRVTLADALSTRFEAFGKFDDLNRAIDTVSITDKHTVHSEKDDQQLLARLLRRRGELTRNRNDLDLAVTILDRSNRKSRSDPALKTNLGNALLSRYRETSNVDDVKRAVALQESAIRLSPPNDWQLASRYNNAGNATLALYEQTRKAKSLSQSIAHYLRAIELTDPQAPELASRYYNLGRSLQIAYELNATESNAVLIAHAYKAACETGLAAGLEWALTAALRWGDWALACLRWGEAGGAYRYALDAIDKLYRRQLGRDEQEAWLGRVRGLAARAAYALAQAGEGTDAAMAIERGRAFILSEVLERDRAELTALEQSGRPALADRYRRASAAVRVAGTATAARAARDELERAILAIREVTGFGDFLEKPRYLTSEEREMLGPIIYLAAAPMGGSAIVVDSASSSPAVVHLELLTEAAVDRQIQALLTAYSCRHLSPGLWAGTLDAVASWLWNSVIDPLLSTLMTFGEATLVPAGRLGLLPLHAAWISNSDFPSGRRYALDEIAFSYAPNARSLLAARQIADGLRVPESILVVDDPQPVTAGPVPAADVEAFAVRRVFPNAQLLRTTEATRAAVLGMMSTFDVLHFACHGVAAPHSPLDTGLIMAGDERLSLQDLFALGSSRTSTHNGRLAVLSACEANRSGEDLPDEVVSLPTGMFQAGVPSIIAPNWAVDGASTAMLMTRFYDCWRSDRISIADALRRAQCWLRDSTNEEKARWFSMQLDRCDPDDTEAIDSFRKLWQASVRKPPKDRTYSHPRHWAAFAHVGAS